MPGGVDRLALGAGLTPIGAFNPLSARGALRSLLAGAN